jgi:hypothetical protein
MYPIPDSWYPTDIKDTTKQPLLIAAFTAYLSATLTFGAPSQSRDAVLFLLCFPSLASSPLNCEGYHYLGLVGDTFANIERLALIMRE